MHEVASKSESHDKQGGDAFLAEDAWIALPFIPPSKWLHTGTPQQRGSHEAESFTTGMFTREVDRRKFLSGIILPIKEDFKSAT